MTVGELIAALSTFEPDMRVIMPGEREMFCDVEAAFVDLIRISEREIQLTDERDGGGTPIVRLFGSDVR